MPLSRFKKLPEAKQNELLGIATEELAKHGFEAVSLSDLLERAGLSKSSFYYYFEDKEDLLVTVVGRLLEEYFESVGLQRLDELTAETFWPAMQRVLAESVEELLKKPALLLILAHLPYGLRTSPKLAPLKERADAYMHEAISKGQKLGCVRTDVPAHRLLAIWDAIDGVMDQTLIGQHRTPEKAELKAHMELAFDFFRRVMAVDAPAISPRPRGKS